MDKGKAKKSYKDLLLDKFSEIAPSNLLPMLEALAEEVAKLNDEIERLKAANKK